MDEKTFNCLARGYKILVEEYNKKHGITVTGIVVGLVDEQEEKKHPADAAS